MVGRGVRVRVERDLRSVGDLRADVLPSRVLQQRHRAKERALQCGRGASSLGDRQVLCLQLCSHRTERVTVVAVEALPDLLGLLTGSQLVPVFLGERVVELERVHEPLVGQPGLVCLRSGHSRERSRHQTATDETTGSRPQQVVGERLALHVVTQYAFVRLLSHLREGVDEQVRATVGHGQLLCSLEEVVDSSSATVEGSTSHSDTSSVEALDQLGRSHDTEVQPRRHGPAGVVEVVRHATVLDLGASASLRRDPLGHTGVGYTADHAVEDVVDLARETDLRRSLRDATAETRLQRDRHSHLRDVQTDETERRELLPGRHLGHLAGLLVVRLTLDQVLDVADNDATDTDLVRGALPGNLGNPTEDVVHLGATLEQRAGSTTREHRGEVETATNDLSSPQPVGASTALRRVLEGGNVVADVATLSETDTTDGQVAERADVGADSTGHGGSVADTAPDTLAVVLVHLDSSAGIAVTNVIEVKRGTDSTTDTTDDSTADTTDDVTDDRDDSTEQGCSTSTSGSTCSGTSANDTDVGAGAHPLELLILTLLLLQRLVVLGDSLGVVSDLVLDGFRQLVLVTERVLIQLPGIPTEQERSHDRVSVSLAVLLEDIAALGVLTLDPDVTGLELALDTVSILDSTRVCCDTRVVRAGHRVDTRLGRVLLLLVHGLQEAVVAQSVQRGPGLATSLPGRAVVTSQSPPGRFGSGLALQRLVETCRSPTVCALGKASPTVLLDLVGARTLAGIRLRLSCHAPSIPCRAPAPLLSSYYNNPA